LPISAVDSVGLAFQHTKKQLVQPFRFWQWTRLAAVGLLAGEMGSGGGCNSHNFKFPQQPGTSHQFLAQGFPNIDPAILGGLIAVLVVTGLVLLIVFTYISSVMRFILFDSVLAKECHIGEGWSRRQGPGWRYFWWQLGFMLVTLAGTAVLLGIPALFAFSAGWFKAPREHVLGLVLGGIALFFVMAFLLVTASVVHVLTKDFVVPQMALEGIGAIEGWRRLWPLIDGEMGGYAAYVGLKIVLAILAAIIIGIAGAILGLIVAIPSVALGIVAVVTGKSAGLTWNALTITVAVVAACILVAILLFLMSLVAVPAIVFFPAYSIYFFAARYQRLSSVLYPPPPPAPTFGNSGGPPPLPPTPAPVG
jgi:hypothetical protein